MSDQLKVNVVFIGQDYSAIDDATVKFTCDEEVKESLKQILPVDKDFSRIEDSPKAKEILKTFLEDKRVKNLTVLGRDGKESGKKRIWDPNFDKGYFCGVVGVVESDMDMYMDDLFPESEESSDFKEIKFHIRLQIQSRMDVASEKTPGKPYFLSTMLLHDKLDLNHINNNTVPTSEDEIFDFLLWFWFREQFLEASRKGFYRTYQRFERNDDRLRGSIDIARHIRMNMGQDNGKIAYSYRENTVNNYINHLIVAAYECLKKKYYDLVMGDLDDNMELKRDMDNLKREIGYSQYTSYEMIAKNLKPIAHPFYTEYEELRKTCIKILRNEGISFFDADRDEDTKSILFYLPDLWEDYLEKEIRSGLKNSSVELSTQELVKVLGAPVSEIETSDVVQGNRFLEQDVDYVQDTYPDYVFVKKFNSNEEATPFMILDAKFKPKWKDAAFPPDKGRKSISDVLPDYDKCIRDMVSIHAHATGVIFPVSPEKEESKGETESYESWKCKLKGAVRRHRISKYNRTDCFYTIPVLIPFAPKKEEGKGEAESYTSWKYKLEENIKETIRELCDDIEKEADFFENIHKKRE